MASLKDCMAAFENAANQGNKNYKAQPGNNEGAPSISVGKLKHAYLDKEAAGKGKSISKSRLPPVTTGTSPTHAPPSSKSPSMLSGVSNTRGPPQSSSTASIADSAPAKRYSNQKSLVASNQDSYSSLSQQRSKKEERANQNPGSDKKRNQHIAICCGTSLLILTFIIGVSVTIITGWGDGSVEPLYKLQSVVSGNLEALSQTGDVVAIQDGFGISKIWARSEGGSTWEIIGGFQARRSVELSKDGRIVAFLDQTTLKPKIKGYDSETQSFVNLVAPSATDGGDDLCLSADANLLLIGGYDGTTGLGAITTYKLSGGNWTVHGKPMLQMPGLTTFKLSPSGATMVTVTEREGNFTLTGYQASSDVDGSFAWQSWGEFPVESGDPSISMSSEAFAVSMDKSAEAFSFSGAPRGQAIQAKGNSNITSVALSADGRTMLVGMTENATGYVEWYTWVDDNWDHLGASLGDIGDSHSPLFGAELAIDENGKTVAVQSGLEGELNVHIYEVQKIPVREVSQ